MLSNKYIKNKTIKIWGAQILQAKAHGIEAGKYSAEKVGIIIR
jgi:hypothetical protein